MPKLSSVRFIHRCNLSLDKPKILSFTAENTSFPTNLTDAVPTDISAVKRAIREALSLGKRTVSLTTDFLIDGVVQTSDAMYEASVETLDSGMARMTWQLIEIRPAECTAQEPVKNETVNEQKKEVAVDAAEPAEPLFTFSKEKERDADSFYITPWLRVTRKGFVIDDIWRGEATIPSIEVAVARESGTLILSCCLKVVDHMFSEMVVWNCTKPISLLALGQSTGAYIYRDRDNNSFNAVLYDAFQEHYNTSLHTGTGRGERAQVRRFEITLEMRGGEVVECGIKDPGHFPEGLRYEFCQKASMSRANPVYSDMSLDDGLDARHYVDPRTTVGYGQDTPRSSSRWQPSREISDTFDRRSPLWETGLRSSRNESSSSPVLLRYSREKARLVENCFPQVLAEIANNPKAYLEEDYCEFILDAGSVVRVEELPDDMLKGLDELHWGSNAEFYEKGVKIWAALLYLSSRRGR